jgi:hypothetical protein
MNCCGWKNRSEACWSDRTQWGGGKEASWGWLVRQGKIKAVSIETGFIKA